MPKRNRSAKPKPSIGRRANSATESEYVGTCPDCGKRSYRSRQEAKRTGARLQPGQRMRFYQCGPWWHMTSADAETSARYRETASGPSPAGGVVQDMPAAEIRGKT